MLRVGGDPGQSGSHLLRLNLTEAKTANGGFLNITIEIVCQIQEAREQVGMIQEWCVSEDFSRAQATAAERWFIAASRFGTAGSPM